MTDDRPKPRWGEYADPAPLDSYPPPAAPAAPEPAATTGPAPHKSRDVIITTALILLGVWDVVAAWSQYQNLGASLRQVFELQGLGEFTSIDYANELGGWINIARAGILVVVIVVSLLLIGRRRLSFWVPLAGAVLAGIVVVALVTAVIVSDPAFAEFLAQSGPTGG